MLLTLSCGGRWPVGSEVGLFKRSGLEFNPEASRIASEVVGESLEVSFDAPVAVPLFAAAEVDGRWRAVAVMAKDESTTDKQVREASPLTAAAPGRNTGQKWIYGARSREDARKAVR